MGLTELQVAIIITLHQEPDYKFVGNEKTAAERMVNHKLLRRDKDGKYVVTAKAEKAYKRQAENTLPETGVIQ